jgi:hypothetical protein
MADEILGNCYELITEITLQDFSKVLRAGEKIFTQETPVGIGIVPDIIIGKDIEKPRILLQVHHTRAERASEKKFWRNVGEYVDARNTLGGSTLIVTIAFDSGQKRKLSAAATHLMDGFLEVDRQPFGKELLNFAKILEAEFETRKTKEDERLALARKRLAAIPSTIAAFKALAAQLNATLSTVSKAGASWFATYAAIQATRSSPRVPSRKLTTLRRALGRLLPVDDEVLLRKLLTSIRTDCKAAWPQYFIDLGIADQTVAGTKFTNPCPPGTRVSRKMESDSAYELFRMTELFDDDAIVRLWRQLRSITTSLSQACASIREANEFALYHKFVVENFETLATPEGMAKALKDCFDNPDLILGKKIGLKNPAEKGVWLFDYIMTVIKTRTGKQQGYGYTQLGADAGFRFEVAATGGVVVSPFLQRRKMVDSDIFKGLSMALANRLEMLGKRWVNLNQSEISRFVLKGQFEDKIYKTASFDPSCAVIASNIPPKGFVRDKRTGTFLTGYTGRGAATCDTIYVGDTLIMWQAAFAGHPADKHKELIGRIGMLRVQHTEGSSIVPAAFRRAVLVIDGTWQDDQIRRLAENGFDAIYYVDEIDQLVKDLNLAVSVQTLSADKKSISKKMR